MVTICERRKRRFLSDCTLWPDAADLLRAREEPRAAGRLGERFFHPYRTFVFARVGERIKALGLRSFVDRYGSANDYQHRYLASRTNPVTLSRKRSDGSLKYQWGQRSEPSGATNSTFTITRAIGHAGTYTIVVANSFGSRRAIPRAVSRR